MKRMKGERESVRQREEVGKEVDQDSPSAPKDRSSSKLQPFFETPVKPRAKPSWLNNATKYMQPNRQNLSCRKHGKLRKVLKAFN